MLPATIGGKVQALLALALAFTVAVGVAGLLSTRSMATVVSSYQEAEVPALAALGRLATAVGRVTGAASALENAELGKEEHRQAAALVSEQVQVADAAATEWAGHAGTGTTVSLRERLQPALESWRKDLDALGAAAQEREAHADNFAEAAAIQSEVKKRSEQLRVDAVAVLALLDQGGEATRARAAAVGEEAQRSEGAARWWLLSALGVATLVLAGSGVILARGVARTVAGVSAQARALREAATAGRLGERADPTAAGIEFRPILDGLNDTMAAVQGPVELIAGQLDRISRGDIPPRIDGRYEGDFARSVDALNRSVAAVQALVADASALAAAGVAGKLSVRADAARHEGQFRAVVQGVNDTLDAVVDPLQAAARCLDAISRGDIPGRVEGSYQGEFGAVRDSLNRCIDAVRALAGDVQGLAAAGVAGALATRADPARHQGEFRSIVVGVNATLDAVTGPIREAVRQVGAISEGQVPPRITAEWQGEFQQLRDGLNRCVEAVAAVIAEVGQLSAAAVAGRLATRADGARHRGEFRRIVEGVNGTLDAITAPMDAAASVLERLADRDLSARVTGEFAGDHGRMQVAINATATALEGALVQVSAAVAQVSNASSQIASSSQAVASGASEQSASLEQTRGTIDTVAEMSARSADHAQRASVLVEAARAAAGDGAGGVTRMQDAMGKVRASAEGTSQIIRDINDIAFQTNLLALNAAVEAARAGEAGRGFAVVAEEVRSLALRAKDAAQKTEALIRESVRQATEGESTSAALSGKLGDIVATVTQITGIVGEIAGGARHQAVGVEGVTRAIAEMDRVTQQNAASAEESSSAASELSGQAEELAAMVATFRLTGRAPERAPASPPALGRSPRQRPALPRPVHSTAVQAFPGEGDDELREF